MEGGSVENAGAIFDYSTSLYIKKGKVNFPHILNDFIDA